MSTTKDELVRLGEQLRQMFAEERRAIGVLDHAALVGVADTKRELVSRLSSFRDQIADPSVRDLFVTLRTEASATAMLAATANAAVRMLLGYDAAASYDSRARTVSHGPSRILAAY